MKKYLAAFLALSTTTAIIVFSPAPVRADDNSIRASQVPLTSPAGSRQYFDTLNRDGD